MPKTMNDFATSLDKYLTTQPDDGFDSWFESVCDRLSKPFSDWDDMADNTPSCSDEFIETCDLLFSAGLTPDEAAPIINQSFVFFDKFLRINDNDPQFDPQDYSDLHKS